jgi:cardiolipin synthase
MAASHRSRLRSSVRDGHHIQLLCNGDEYFPALIAALDAAQTLVHLETYIFDATGQGAQVAQALLRTARRGVSVRLLVDGVGTGPLPKLWAEQFAAAGVQCCVYSPLGRLGLLIPSRWRRLHRKLCVIDGQVAFCGGINILDDRHDPYHGPLAQPRLDFAVQAQGPLVQEVQAALNQLWWRIQLLRNVRQRQFPQALQALRLAGNPAPGGAVGGVAQQPSVALGMTRACLVLRDNWRHRRQIELAYRQAISQARSDILIANAYFLPGRKLRQALIHAAQRGVKVQLLLQGRYEYFMQFHGARPVYHALLKAGVEIHEYTASFLHAKVAVVDAATPHAWATVGSSNLDPLSLLLAREANVVVQGRAFANQLRERLLQALTQGSLPLVATDYLNRPLHQRVLDHLAYGLMRLALWLAGRRY